LRIHVIFALEVMGRSTGLAQAIVSGADHTKMPIGRLGF